MNPKPHRAFSLRLSTAVAVIAVLGLAVGIVALRNGGSAKDSPSEAAVLNTAPAVARTVSASSTPTQIYKSIHGSVVKITTESGLGMGIVLDKSGDILTNDHVVEGANRFNVTFDSSGAGHTARLVGTDPSDDLAVVKIDPSGLNLQPVTLGDSSSVQVGDTVYAIGNPFGYTNSFSEGIVSGLDRTMTAPNGFTIGHSIQTDAAINPGNSGGPLLNASGEVVGINAQIASNGSNAGGEGQNNGVGFAIPVNTAKSVIPQLEKSGRVSHGYLGISTADNNQGGATVAAVQSGSPAERAGIQQGDVIHSIDGQTVNSSEDVVSMIEGRSAGTKVTIKLERSGSSRTVTLTLGQQPSQAPNAG
ncbi:MAG TPA: trypsin-like peptidase domain-containing protein [Thermoleophilaceae bacterium]|nr:trypsin-like peptidase domain-containing protein [Thermoleophilaceae bacterium]